MKKIITLILFLCLPLFLSGTEMKFKWAIISGEDKVLTLKPRSRVKPGERFKFIIEAMENSYIYIFAYSKQGELTISYPSDEDAFLQDEYWDKVTFVPPLREWFTIPNETPGEGEIFFISAPMPLKNLAPYLKPKLTKEELEKLYRELKTMVRDYTLLRVFHEKAVPLYGTIKHNDPKQLMVTEITCQNLYLKWYKLDY